MSTNPNVRFHITELCRKIGEKFSLVADGRDTGSVVFPRATVKFYLIASLEIRAKRWQEYLRRQGTELSLVAAEKHVVMRDKRDMDRAISPLVVPENAVVLDNSTMGLEEVVEKMQELVAVHVSIKN